MLAGQPPIAFVATASRDRAKEFYSVTLGLPLVSEDQFALVFDLAGVPLRVQVVRELQPQSFTALGWRVDDAAATVETLEGRGVQFERYPFLKQDGLGIWEAPGGARVAWFKDPDGNILSVTQFGAT